MEGVIRKSSKLRIGFFAQHQLDELIPGETPLQHMARLRPDELLTKLRARLSAAGIGPDIIENSVEKLSGGQKARLLMALAAIDAPHILILDEPTNHLDIESREALIHAINDYQGAIILVSHDAHLVETIADQLWIVQGGALQLFEGDMDDYRQQLLQNRSSKGQASFQTKQTSESVATEPLAKLVRAPSGKERRASTSKIRQAITKNEKKIEKFNEHRLLLEREMTSTSFFDSTNRDRVAAVSRELASVNKAKEDAEDEWIKLQEMLDYAINK
jgi:ATP-binding cassette subfamily F protein 3